MDSFESTSIKEWNAATDNALKLQEEWKKSGAIPKEKGKLVWEEFRSSFDVFFGKKNISKGKKC